MKKPSKTGERQVAQHASVVEEHRRRIDAATLDPETKRYVVDLLDAVFIDLLQAVLDETSALEVLRNNRRGPG